MTRLGPNDVIGLDLSCLDAGPMTGVERYAARLAEHLPAALGPARLVTLRPASPPSSTALWRRRELPRLCRERGVTLLHCPVASTPRLPGVPVTRTVHDVPEAWPDVPDDAGPLVRWRARRALRRHVPTVVPTEATRRDLERVLGPRADRAPIRVIPHGVDPRFLGAPPDRAGVPDEPYFLVVGTVRARRRPELIVRAAEEAGAGRLVWVGAGAPPGAAGAFVGYRDDDDVTRLVFHARAVICPSAVEGFGLPALEAMAAGTPLVCADIPALREVAGEAAVYFDGFGALVTALREVDASRIEQGRSRASALTWPGSAAAHTAFFAEVAARR